MLSKLDAKNGYWGIKLDAESQLLTTFNTPFSRYCFMGMPFGLIMSQDVFQQRIDIILEQCSGTIGIADDVVVYGRDKSVHDAHLNRLMQVASQEGLLFNGKKCEINVDSVKFLSQYVIATMTTMIWIRFLPYVSSLPHQLWWSFNTY